ncbi:type II CRISPR RNA-guided endonuclease Cas9 [Pseudopedobacter beijingensis]|uniref:CRISPR-associated endonuclease Cas9 n=1 Tax=Pseudopedobacter beijingensis TaxID=1207056 RepID=A0ABW4I9R5_9SPHI
MDTKKVLGLDIGTNSIGAALISTPKEYENYGENGNIEWIGSRIIPLDGDYLQKFESGAQAETKAAFRRGKRGSRRLKHRYKLRRKRLIQVLKELKWIDENFPLDDSRKFKQDINESGYSLKISDYLPFSEETIAEFEKELGIENQKSKKGKSIVPEDWIVYFLRKKALTQKIEIPELVRILYVFNQRRGFKSSRKDLKDTNVLPYDEFIKRKEQNEVSENGIETQFVAITKIKTVTFKEEKKDKKGNVVGTVYIIEAEDPRMETWEETRKKEPDWAKETNEKGEKIDKKEFTFLVVQKIDKNGKSTQLKPQMPKADDWALCTTALSEKIEENKQHPGEYFYDELKKAYKANRSYKIRQYPVYRWRYQKELEAIWNKQCEFNEDLKRLNTDKNILTKLAEILYPTQAKNNMPKLAEFQGKDLLHIISNDIIYYQRELKSQRNSISECRYEKRKGIDNEFYGLKCIPRSSPFFQEFRIWQDIHNIKILKREEKVDGKTKLDIDVTVLYVDEDIKEKLFDLFQSKPTISEKEILNLIKENNEKSDIVISDKKDGEHSHRINLFANRESLKGNETLVRYRSVFKKASFDGEDILSDKGTLQKLWHIDYSITSSDEEKSKKGITTALTNLLPENPNKTQVIEAFCKLSELKNEYGSYSACAIKKLLPVMRCGKHWNEQDISEQTTKRATKIKERLESVNNSIKRLNEIADDDVQKQVLKSFIGKDDLTKGLNTYQAGYLIYDKHSEKDKTPIHTVEELSKYIQKEIPNNSLRNPVVEQIVRETMFLVRDVWSKYGDIDEIHIELGRDLKNNAVERKKISENQKGNFDEKQRIKKLLYELMNDGIEQYNDDDEVEQVNFEVNPNPESPIDIDKFRIWRNLTNKSEIDWAKKVKDEKIPTEQEIKKYALWLSQNCRSPYTGKIIPLSKLFDKAQYEIEHIIPRKKMKNDSFNNLVIAEAAINPKPYKGELLARNFIAQYGGKEGREYEISGKKYFILGEELYETYCKETFKFQKGKLKNLLATEVPDDFIERQLNDTRYIGRKLSELLAPVAKNENGVIFTGGAITSELKNNWGLNKVWKEIILPRFERLEEITGKKGEYVLHDKDEHGNPVIHLNVKENPKLNTKRIDHRHHALDALIIATTTREHIRYLNTLNAADTEEEIKKIKQSLVKGKVRDFKKPWENFTKDAKDKLEELVVSFKTNNKIISQPKNRTAYYKTENGKIKKEFKEQKANPKWMSVRRSMFKEPQGIIYLKEVYEEKNIAKAIEIQIDRMLVQNTPEMKIAPYVYDQEARKIIRDLIDRIGIFILDKETLLKELKKHLKKNPLKNFIGEEYKCIQVAKFEEYAAKRVTLDDSFDKKKIDKIPYAKNGKSILGKLLHEHLREYEEFTEQVKAIEEKQKGLKKQNPNSSDEEIKQMLSDEERNTLDNRIPEPFKGEGLENLAKKAGKPITKVTIYEKKDSSSKFGKQYVEIDAGSNVYFVMYENQQTKERTDFRSVATHKAIEKIIKGEPVAEEKDGFDKIVLLPGDLVYVPTNEEREGIKEIDWQDKRQLNQRTYKVGRFSKKQCYFLKASVSDLIISYDAKLGFGEFGSTNYQEFDDEKNKIAEVCIKLKVDRLGNISKA